MATLAGGVTIATVGTTAAENEVITTILQNDFKGVIAPEQVTIAQNALNSVSTQLLVGTFEATSVQNETVTTATPGGLAVVNTDSSGSGSSKSVTNLAVDNNVGAVILSGSGNVNTLTGVILSDTSTASLIVGNAGSSIINANFSTKNLTIVAGAGNDTIVTGTGNDRVGIGEVGIANGGGGADTLIGGSGSATLGGGAGADSIVAGTGGGMLIGEVGDDTMVGGAGNDVFIYRSGDGSDVINGFNPASDTLALAVSGVNLLDVISRATVSGGNTIITMADGSTITLAGVTGININWFTIK